METLILRFLSALLLMVTLLLTACGGGGSSPEPNTKEGNLVLSYSYENPPSGTYGVLQTISLRPTLTGIGSNVPSFALTKGSLPPGLTLNASTGEVSGVLTQSGGPYNATITLSVSGFTGTLEAPLLMAVSGISGSYLSGPIQFRKNVPISLLPSFVGVPPGALVTYSVGTTPLPAALQLNTATGELSGTFATGGNFTYSFKVNFRVSRLGYEHSGQLDGFLLITD
jgi:hypothetical protein